MYVAAFFTENGVPKTLLTPTLRIRNLATNALVVTDAAMSEVGDGWYKYNFTTYSASVEYAIRCDGGAGLPANERYVVAGNDEPSGGLIADAVWDEIITGASHNTPTSAGRRLRTITDDVIINGFVISSTENTVTFDGDASSTDGAYDPAIISIINGLGAGQSRLILEYAGATKTAVVDRNWKIQPNATSEYIIVSDPGREHVNEGMARGGTANTITLNTLASSHDNAYRGQVVFLRAGTGEDQACRVIAYDGTTKIATVAHDWGTIPDSTTSYVMLPTAVMEKSYLANAVWDELLASHTTAGSAAKILVDMQDALETVKQVETGRWQIVNNQMLFYDTNGTVILTFDLLDESGNPTMRQVYERVPA